MSGKLRWAEHAGHWPNADVSRFVEAGGVSWHAQLAGEGEAPVVVLLHGTGASTHSWRDVLPGLCARGMRVLAPDLPGHGFSSRPATLAQMSVPGMSAALGALYRTLGVTPRVMVGHSAGAAIALRQCVDGWVQPDGIVSLNGAILPFPGVTGKLLFGPLARAVARIGPLAPLFAWHARSDRQVVRELLGQTGSRLAADGEELYRILAGNRAHVRAALDMMSQWDLAPLREALPGVRVPTLLVTGERDHTVPPSQAEAVHALMPTSRVERLADLGHLAHEEAPARICALIAEMLEAPETKTAGT